MGNERIKLEMSMMQAILAMSGGNPKAMQVCTQLVLKGDEIDPDSAQGGFGFLLSLDMLNIWEDRIWMLYNDVCESNITYTCAVLRAWQLGQIGGTTEQAINLAIDNHGQLDLEAILAAVREELPQFAPIEEASDSEQSSSQTFEKTLEAIETILDVAEEPVVYPKPFMQRVEDHANAHPGIWLGAIAAGLVILLIAGLNNVGGFFEDSVSTTQTTTEGH